MREPKSSTRKLVVSLGALSLCAVMAIGLAFRQRGAPARCPDGMNAIGSRCCGAGQALRGGRCGGAATSCSRLQALDSSRQCVAVERLISIQGGELNLGAADSEGHSETVRLGRARVQSLRLDAGEVTHARWARCTAAGRCRRLSGEPGLPVSDVTPPEAQEFCAWSGGRLPKAEEWVLAAAGTEARRYPWGMSGLVCRRAAFGLSEGPCASGGGVELGGSRPDGSSPEGAFDLSGNVAEWTLEVDGSYAARGGSYRSRAAAELKSWSVETTKLDRARHIGFRCAYAAEATR